MAPAWKERALLESLLRRPTASLAAALVVVATALTACQGNFSGLGFSRTPDGDVVVHFALCPGDQVEKLTVSRDRSDVVAEWDLVTLWAIRATDPGDSTDVFTVGRTPRGFTEVGHLDAPLPSADQLYVQIAVDGEKQGVWASYFSPALLREGLIRIPERDEFVTESEFDQLRAASCP